MVHATEDDVLYEEPRRVLAEKWPAGENPASYHMTRAAETAKETKMIMKWMKDIEKAELFLLFGTEHGLSAETRLRSSG